MEKKEIEFRHILNFNFLVRTRYFKHDINLQDLKNNNNNYGDNVDIIIV